MLFALTLRGDTVELKTGEHLDGTFLQAGAAGVVIEIAGQMMTIPLENVQGIYFGAARPALASPAPPPSGEALDALRALRSATESGISFRDYAPRVLDAKIKADKFLSASADHPSELRSAIGLAMREYALAFEAWNAALVESAGREAAVSRVLLEDPEISQCPAIRELVKTGRSRVASRYPQMSDKGHIDIEVGAIIGSREANSPLWTCASAQVAEAERLLSQPANAPKLEASEVAGPRIGN
jgi:hypothetical protein